jgi:RNA-directed DNA polymerase
MNGREKSDPAVVAVKLPNKTGRPVAEAAERRAGAKGNAGQQSTHRAQNRERVSQALDRVRQAARRGREERFTALLHHVNVDALRLAFDTLRRDAAGGVDGVTWSDYDEGLESRLQDLHRRIHSGAYRPRPARRTYIPKVDGRMRPLAIAALEDKIVQSATANVLNAIYEMDFVGFSYGFRPGRSAHDALDALAVGISRCKVNYVLDADIRSFFDSVSQDWLVRFVEHRIGDPRIVRLIRKWLKAGVLEDGVLTVSEQGTGQGSVISPLLANVYLHYVFDLWAARWRRREATGSMIIVRYADDFCVGFEHEADGRRFLDALQERLGKFALSLHPEKTRLIEFGPYAAARRARRGQRKPATFNFLGFTHICGTTRTGRFSLHRHTRRDRMRAKLCEIKVELRRRMHDAIPDQGRWLRQVVNGFFNYHAVPTNFAALAAFQYHVAGLWLRVLRRRSQRRDFPWARAVRLRAAWLPRAQIRHPWPDARFAVTHPRWEPDAGKPHVRLCAGGAQ